MLVLFVLVTSLLAFRALGFAGIDVWSSWHSATRYALAVMFLFTSTSHFTRMKQDLVQMVPAFLPYRLAIVYFTGVCEVLGAFGLMVPALSRLAGFCLVLLLIVMFPANVNASIRQVTLRGKPATNLWIRAPMQLLFIGLTWWSTQY